MSGVMDQEQNGALRLPPVATIRDAVQLRSSALELLARENPAIVDCSAVEHADLSVVQVLVAVRRMARRDGIDLRLEIPPAGALAELIRQSGFEREFADLWS